MRYCSQIAGVYSSNLRQYDVQLQPLQPNCEVCIREIFRLYREGNDALLKLLDITTTPCELLVWRVGLNHVSIQAECTKWLTWGLPLWKLIKRFICIISSFIYHHWPSDLQPRLVHPALPFQVIERLRQRINHSRLPLSVGLL